jgi:integrase
MTINYHLQGTKEPKRIMIIIRYGTQRFKLSTPYKIDSIYWSEKKQDFKNTYININKIEQLNYLNNLKTKVKEYCSNDTNINMHKLKNHVKNYIHNGDYKEIATFFDYIDDYIDKCDTRLSKHSENKLSENVKVRAKELKAKLQEFDDSIDFDSIDNKFYDNFIIFLRDNKKFKNNTIGGYIKTLKTILYSAENDKIKVNSDFKRFHVLKEDVQNVYLNEEELDRIKQLKLSNELSNSRNIFIIGCYTGLRYSDFSRLTMKNVDEQNNIIMIKQQKTGAQVTIPILDNYVISLIKNKENYKVVKEQVLNRNIKKICELAQICNNFVKNGKTYKKYELCSTHTARRSFCSNLYKRNIPVKSIMAISGHKTENSFYKYIKISQEENVELVSRLYNGSSKINLENISEAKRKKILEIINN